MFKSRFPYFNQILPVYGVIVLLLYGWTIYTLLWNLPAWILFRTASDIAITFCYGMAVDFLESILFLFLITALAVILPKTWMRGDFVFMGSIFSIGVLGGIMHIIATGKLHGSITYYPLVIAVVIFLIRIAGLRFPVIRQLIEDFAGRCIIFIYLSLPVSVISLFIVLFRNLQWQPG